MDLVLFGDSALLLSLEDGPPFTPLRLGQALDAGAFAAMLDWVATPDSLMIRFDPLQTSIESLKRTLEQFLVSTPLPELASPQTHTIPVTYNGADLQELAAYCTLSVADIIELHSAPLYTVLMIGFLPGFPYLTGLPSELQLPRRATPRPKVVAGSVAIAGSYAGIYPQTSPGGWHILGHTAVRLFDCGTYPPVLLRPGDYVRFTPL